MKNNCNCHNALVALSCRAFLGWAFLAAPFAVAQDSESPDDVYELSPFVVSADTDGYAARNSLAGSRINTELKDLPNSISVMTTEFLDDIAATSPQDAMLYSLNVQNMEEYQQVLNTAGVVANFTYDGMNGGRVRGLPGSGRSRDFFRTEMRADTYNLGRVTINSGANAVLYGLGGVAGIINDSYIIANTNEDKYTFGLLLDSYGTRRATADLNKVLLDGKLAFRVALLDEDTGSYKENANDGFQHRQFVTATYKPSEKSTFKAYFENVSTDEQYLRSISGFDGGAVAYLNYANSVEGDAKYFDNSPGWTIDGPWVGLVSRGNAVSFGANRPQRNIFVSDANGLNFIGNIANSADAVVTVERSRQAERASDQGFSYSLPESWTYPEQNLMGNTSRRSYAGNIFGASFQHSFTENLNVELAYNKERFDFSNSVAGWGAREYELRADPNMYLPDGVTPNPYKGMLYMEANGFDTQDPNRLEGYRATVSYRLQAPESARWLGRHDFTVLHEYNEKDRRWLLHRKKVLFPGESLDGYTYDPSLAQNRFRFYVDPRTGESPQFPFDTHAGGEVSTGEFVYANSNSLVRQNFWDGESNKDKSWAATMQSSWLEGRLTTTAGVRDQKQWSGIFKDYGTPVSTGSPNFVNAVPNYGAMDMSDANRDFGVPAEPDLVKSYGAVLDVTPNISLHYNWSDTFATPSSNITFEGPVGGATGETEEYGISFNTTDGTSGIRYTQYTASVLNDSNCAFCSSIRNPIFDIESQVHGTSDSNFESYIERAQAGEAIFADAPSFDPGNYTSDMQIPNFNMTNDVIGDGYEIEAFSTFKGFFVRLTMAKNNAQGSGYLKGYGNYILEREPYWKQWAEWEDSKGLVDDGTSIVARQFALIVPSYVGLSNKNGQSVDQGQGIRSNATVRYNFTEGKLRGFNVGGHARYREAGVIGYKAGELPSDWSDWPGFGDTVFSEELSSPVYGKDQLLFDFFAGYNGELSNKIDYNVRLNIRNVLDKDGVIPQRVDSFGVTRVYTYQTPRKITLSTEFTF